MTDRSLPAAGGVLTLPSPQVRHYTDNAKAANTRKAYRIDWDAFEAWCKVRKLASMPAAPETLAAYLAGLADAGAKVATISRRCSSISVAHQMGGYEQQNPAHSGLVRPTTQGIWRTLGTAHVQKAPLVTAELTRLVAACDQLSPLLAARDRALPLIAAAGASRRSELLALDVPDIPQPREGLQLTLRRSQTDHDAA